MNNNSFLDEEAGKVAQDIDLKPTAKFTVKGASGMPKWLPVRRYWVFLVTAAAVLFGIAALLALFQSRASIEQTPAGINHEGYRRIKLGMTLKEIEGILGKPPGDYGDVPHRVSSTWDDESEGDSKGTKASRLWESEQALIQTNFDRNGKAIYKAYQP